MESPNSPEVKLPVFDIFINILKKLREIKSARNNDIFAIGYDEESADEYNRFISFCKLVNSSESYGIDIKEYMPLIVILRAMIFQFDVGKLSLNENEKNFLEIMSNYLDSKNSLGNIHSPGFERPMTPRKTTRGANSIS